MPSKCNYIASILFIIIWWLIALKTPVATPPIFLINELEEIPANENIDLYPHLELLNLNRDEIKKGLDGNVSIMIKLINVWDIESEFLEQQGIKNIKRLSRNDFIKSQILEKILTNTSQSVDEVQDTIKQKLIIDCLGVPFDLNNKFEKFLPQTYLSAGILLALTDPQKIVALPHGMRKQIKIYPEAITSKIKLDLDLYQSEKIFKMSPNLAIVSPSYSHFSTIEALKNQNIPIFNMNAVNSIEELKKSINDLGLLCQQPLKGELLKIFIEAALNAIDNNRLIKNSNFDSKDILIVNFHTHYSLPGRNTLTYDLITRLGQVNKLYNMNDNHYISPHSISIEEEDILFTNPEALLIITLKKEFTLNFFYQTKIFQSLNAAKKNQIAVLDEEIQQTSSQYAVLAYYDINKKLCNLRKDINKCGFDNE